MKLNSQRQLRQRLKAMCKYFLYCSVCISDLPSPSLVANVLYRHSKFKSYEFIRITRGGVSVI